MVKFFAGESINFERKTVQMGLRDSNWKSETEREDTERGKNNRKRQLFWHGEEETEREIVKRFK